MTVKLVGSKSDSSSFRKQGQAWFPTTDLPSDVTVVVDSMSFHLHKFPLLSRCGLMESLVKMKSDVDDVIHLDGLPGGSSTFELVVKFCYGVKLEITPVNVVRLRSASVWLRMTEEYGGDGNLISLTDGFISNVVLRSWRDCLLALKSFDDGDDDGEVGFVEKCVEVLGRRISGEDRHLHQRLRCGSVLWNGIVTGARSVGSDWWYEDVSSLSFPIYKRLISVLENRALPPDIIAGSLVFYAKRYLPGLNRRHSIAKTTGDTDKLDPSSPTSVPAVLSDEEEQMTLIEEIETMLPMPKGVVLVPTSFLAGMLRTVMILGANRRRESSVCMSNLERRVGLQLDHAGLEDLLLPNLSHSVETLYNVDSVHRIVNHFLITDNNDDDDITTTLSSSSLTPITSVGKLIDGYLAEIASDVNLKPSNFQSLAAIVPEYARPLDDGLYRAIDIYFKSHPCMKEPEKEALCKLLDCQKLSTEACTHAAQNDRLPVRMVVQVLFFEQLQLRSSIAGCFLVSSENLLVDHRRSSMVTPPPPPLSETVLPRSCEVDGGGWSENVKVDMDNMSIRVAELERECWSMKQEIEKMGKLKRRWRSVQKKFGFKIKSHQMCTETNTSVFVRKNK